MARFPGTILAQTNDPKEIQRADLDLLDKLNTIAAVSALADTAARLASVNPVVLSGQIAFETDTGYFKIGTDGKTKYIILKYLLKKKHCKEYLDLFVKKITLHLALAKDILL